MFFFYIPNEPMNGLVLQRRVFLVFFSLSADICSAGPFRYSSLARFRTRVFHRVTVIYFFFYRFLENMRKKSFSMCCNSVNRDCRYRLIGYGIFILVPPGRERILAVIFYYLQAIRVIFSGKRKVKRFRLKINARTFDSGLVVQMVPTRENETIWRQCNVSVLKSVRKCKFRWNHSQPLDMIDRNPLGINFR